MVPPPSRHRVASQPLRPEPIRRQDCGPAGGHPMGAGRGGARPEVPSGRAAHWLRGRRRRRARGRALKGDVTGRCVTPSRGGGAARDVREGEAGSRSGSAWGDGSPVTATGAASGVRPGVRPAAGPPPRPGARGRRGLGVAGARGPSVLPLAVVLLVSFCPGPGSAPAPAGRPEELRWWRAFTRAFPLLFT